MFTGIIDTIGVVKQVKTLGEGREIYLNCESDWQGELSSGQSVAVNGACQTVSDFGSDWFSFFASNETLACTNLVRLGPKDRVNLEPALKFGGRIDGHFVSGHVDSTAKVVYFSRAGGVIEFGLELPPSLLPLVAVKGSLAVDGISLTIQSIKGGQLGFVIIPESLKRTTIASWKVGDLVNLEVDLLARYLARWLESRGERSGAGLEARLKEVGFDLEIRRED